MTNLDTNKPGTDPSPISAPTRMIAGYAITNGLTYLAAKGYITADQIGPLGSWLLEGLPFVIVIAHGIYLFVTTTKAALVSRVQNMKKVNVVTTDKTLSAVPGITTADPQASTISVTVPKN